MNFTQKTAIITIAIIMLTAGALAQTNRLNATYTAYLDGASTGTSSFNVGNLQPGDSGMWVIDVLLQNESALYMRINVTEDLENSCMEPEEAYEGIGCTAGGELDDNMKFTAWVDDGDLVQENNEPTVNINENWLKLVRDQTLLDFFQADKEYRVVVEWELPLNTTSIAQTDSAELTLSTAAAEPRNETVTTTNGAVFQTSSSSGGGGRSGGSIILSTITGNNGNSNGNEIKNEMPVADFEYTVLEEFNVEFNASASTDEDGTIEEYKWFFGSETETSSFYIIEHQFREAGEYEVTLQVKDNLEGKTNITKTVTVPGTETEVLQTPENSTTQEEPTGAPTGLFTATSSTWWPWLLLLLVIPAYGAYRKYG